jgi:hypothetical protein
VASATCLDVACSHTRKVGSHVPAVTQGGPGASAQQEGTKSKEAQEQAAAARSELNRLLGEYYQLDHEGTAGGLKTRWGRLRKPCGQRHAVVWDCPLITHQPVTSLVQSGGGM